MASDEAVAIAVSRDTLRILRDFADAHVNEYGGLDERHAVMDAGLVLGVDDPTPRWDADVEGLRHLEERGVYTEGEVDEYLDRVERLSGGESGGA